MRFLHEEIIEEAKLEKLITSELNNMLYSNFAILTYDLEKKCYAPRLNTITDLESENLVISTRDRLYREIRHDNYGIMLKASKIHEDPVLKKKFSSDRKIYPLYFISLDRLTSRLHSTLNIGNNQASPYAPESILLLQLDNNTPVKNKVKLYQSLKQWLSVPFYLYNNNNIKKFNSLTYENWSRLYSYLDYLISIFSHVHNGIGIIAKIKNHKNNELVYLTRYLTAKLRVELKPATSVIQVNYASM